MPEPEAAPTLFAVPLVTAGFRTNGGEASLTEPAPQGVTSRRRAGTLPAIDHGILEKAIALVGISVPFFVDIIRMYLDSKGWIE